MDKDQILPTGEPISAACPSQTPPPRLILLVEDESLIRQCSTEALVRAGYAVETAVDGAAGWDALKAGAYDLMITDNKMPKLTGVELLEKLRAAQLGLPVIMATGALPTPAIGQRAWRQPEAILLKPYTIEELLWTVKRVLRDVAGTADRARPNRPSDAVPAPQRGV